MKAAIWLKRIWYFLLFLHRKAVFRHALHVLLDDGLQMTLHELHGVSREGVADVLT